MLITILIIQLLTDSLTIWELSPYSKKLIWGAMLLVIMFLNHLYNRYRQKRQLERTVKGVS